jgi:hypothetical protein
MGNKIKKLLGYILLILFSYQAIGAYFTFFIWKIYSFEKIEEYAATLPNESLIQITKPNTGELLSEFEENNRLYDVIRYQIVGHQIIYYCIDDSTENSLKSDITEHSSLQTIKKENNQNTKNCIKRITDKKVFYFEQSAENINSKLVFQYSEKKKLNYIQHSKIESPPPELRFA